VCLKGGTDIIFMASHFIHGEQNAQKRVKQYHYSKYLIGEKIARNEVVIWAGDFNSRMEDISAPDMMNLLNSTYEPDMLDHLIEVHDQLRISMRKRETFVDFNEPQICFKPSYKLCVGSDSYDLQRTPSWCDRIIYKGPAENFRVLRYSSYQRINLSDHFPISAHFILDKVEFNVSLSTSQDSNLWTMGECVFDEIPTWAEYVPLFCHIYIEPNFLKTNGSNFDWIGIFSIQNKNFLNPERWTYIISCSFDDNQQKLVAEFDPLQPGKYQAGYFSRRCNCLQAMSNVFTVREILDRPY